jgi:hypothetical protein
VTAAPKPPPDRLVPSQLVPLDGDEKFSGLDATVRDFWRWAYWDLRDNTVRGVLAEFLVAAALGRTDTRRKGWDNYDVLSEAGVRVEVKESGYLQSWVQASRSRLNFGRVAARTWDEKTNAFGAEPEVRADVFVFAVQTCSDPDSYDPLDVAQWDFYVVPAPEVRNCGYTSVSIAWVRQRAEPVEFAQLSSEIALAAGG